MQNDPKKSKIFELLLVFCPKFWLMISKLVSSCREESTELFFEKLRSVIFSRTFFEKFSIGFLAVDFCMFTEPKFRKVAMKYSFFLRSQIENVFTVLKKILCVQRKKRQSLAEIVQNFKTVPYLISNWSDWCP